MSLTTPNPIDHPAAWRCSELAAFEEWNQTLSKSEVSELLEVSLPLRGANFDWPIGAEPPVRSLSFQNKLHAIQDRLENGCGAARLLGFPADDVDEATAKAAFWVLTKSIGTPISQSAAGDRIFDVRDAGFADSDKRARGPNTRKKLSFHTDRCDVIGFLCYRQAKSGGENLVVSSISIFNRMSQEFPDLAKILLGPFLYQRHNVDLRNELPYTEQPIFSLYEGHFAANLLRVLIDRAYAMPDTPNMSEQQRAALDKVEELASQDSMHFRFRQEQGDILFLNNFVTLHRRTAFEDYTEPHRKRHLLRVWLSVPNSRPLDPRFGGNYGETAAGAIRGGMRSAKS